MNSFYEINLISKIRKKNNCSKREKKSWKTKKKYLFG